MRLSMGALVCTAVLMLSSVALANPPEKAGAPAVRRGATAVRAEKDQRLAELQAMTNQSSEGLRVVKRRDGVRMVDLQGRFMHVSVGDGQTVRTCSTGSDVISRLLSTHLNKPKAPETQTFRFALEVE